MIVIVAMIAGAITGALVARRRKGNRLDMLQYGAVYMVMFAIVAMFLTLIIEKSL